MILRRRFDAQTVDPRELRIAPEQTGEMLVATPMTHDISSLRLVDADGFYAALIQAHEGLSEAESALANAKLVMLLANQVGDAQVLQVCLDAAVQDIRATPRRAAIR